MNYALIHCNIIDGNYVMPGLINAHVHLFGSGKPMKALTNIKKQERMLPALLQPSTIVDPLNFDIALISKTIALHLILFGKQLGVRQFCIQIELYVFIFLVKDYDL